MMRDGTMGHWLDGPFGVPLAPLAVLLIVLAGVAFLLVLRQDTTGSSRDGEDALEVLRRRYARGEIDRAEFEERRRVLDGS